MFRRCTRHVQGPLFLEHALSVSLHYTVSVTLHLELFFLLFLLVICPVLLQCSFWCFAWVIVAMLIIVVTPFIVVLSPQFFRIVVCWRFGDDVKG